MNIAYKDTKGYELVTVIIVGLVLPPFFSMIYLLYMTIRYRSEKIGMTFIFFFALFLTYNFFSIDNIGRTTTAMQMLDGEQWFAGDPLTHLMHLVINKTSLQCSHILFLYIFLTYLFWFKTFIKSTKQRLSTILVLICLTAISLRSSIDLLYYCMGVTFTLWFITSKHFNIINLTALIVSVYLIHPGVMLLLLPSIGLYYSLKLSIAKSKYLYYYISLVLVFVFAFFLSKLNSITLTGNVVVDALIESYSNYTGDGGWGRRSGVKAIHGITYTVAYILIPFVYGIIFYFSIKHANLIKNKKVLCLFQTAMLFYPNYINYVTLSERNLLVLSITSILVFIMLNDINKDKYRFINLYSILCVSMFVFMFNYIKMDGAVQLSRVFRAGSYESVRNRSFYIPSVILLDYEECGYSNDFIKYNAIVSHD